jgi:citrate synthase
MSGKAVLTLDGQSIELDTLVGTEGEKAINIKPLRAKTGFITMDPGYLNTGSCQSSITFIDGEKGILHYRGYPIEELAEKSSFLEVAYLLVYGKLPTKAEYDVFVDRITNHTLLNERLKKMFEGFPQDAHPMAILSSMVVALSTYYPDALDPLDPEQVDVSVIRLLAKMPTIAAYSYKASLGEPFIYPDNKLSYTANFLKMMFGYPTTGFEVDEYVAKVLDVLLILHADHEQNCSATTVRVVGSSRANIFASISAGINALWGPLHGGANQEVLEMLDLIVKDGNDVEKYIKLAQDKSSNFRLMGFGHRVYKNYDPRAKILKGMADRVLAGMNRKDPLLDVARKLEERALNDAYFKDRNLYPNVDFYSGIIYRAMGLPVNMFTVMFALGRLPGWIAQWKEGLEHQIPIGRPRQIYTGGTNLHYVPMSERG